MKFTIPQWLRNAVFYEIYPQSFYDTNGDGIGDLPGIIQKLDYIQSLGVNAVWLNPCFTSPFQDAGYDVADFYQVAPRYGTNADLKRLFREAGRRGIRICLDLVAGHTSIDHPWFRESCRATPNRYSNWFIWTSHWGQGGGQLRTINGYAERDGNYVINFFYCQPALNYGFAQPDPKQPWQLSVKHPDVQALRAEMKKIMRYWLDLGCAGFRVDMASSLVKLDKGFKETSRWWHEVRGMFEKDYPEAVLIAEWSNPSYAVPAGFHVDFMVHFGEPGYTKLFRAEPERIPNSPFTGGRSFFDRKGGGDAATFAQEVAAHLRKLRGRGYLSVPTGNHDIGRIAQGRNQRDLETAYAAIFSLPGVPFLYYGDEIGQDFVTGLASKEGGYNRTGARTPMQWDASRNAGFSTAPAKALYLPIQPERDRPTVAAQEKDSGSLLNCTRRLIALRRQTPALDNDGGFTPLYAQPECYPLVYLRTSGRDKIVVAVNPAGKPAEASFAVKGAKEVKETLLARGAELVRAGGKFKVKLAGASYGWFRVG